MIFKRCAPLKYLLFCVLLGASLLATSYAYAAPVVIDPSDGIDAIIVIDTSGSMREADPERIALEAASLFMDMMETRNSRIGIVGFSGSLHSVMPLTSIGDPSIRDEIRNTISNFVYHGWTDIGLALRTAAEMIIDDPVTTNSPMILLFTDGRVDLGIGERTVDMSYADAWWAVDAVGDNVPIYTIGLNFDGDLNFEFLREVAERTNARNYIAEEAGVLPQIFNAIFASHIRSSITEVATVVATGDEHAEVLIPIPSAFVSEANIIMLSSQPIVDARLFDPSGREIVFDEDTYTLTYANRYSMIKVLAPMVGDWLLSVKGLPEDRITINLIYNYNVDVSFSISQPDMDGSHFDPNYPITVQAGFISPLPGAQIQALFTEADAVLSAYDMDMNRLASVEMNNTGTAFITDFKPHFPQDIRLSISVTHPGFEQTTSFVTINYDPQMLEALTADVAEIPPPPTPTPEPTPTPPTQPTPSPEITNEPEGTNSTVFVLLGIAVALLIAAILLRMYALNQQRQKVFIGHLELRALLDDGKYTALEAPDLSTFAGRISMMEFLNNSLGAKADKITQSGVPIYDIYIQPTTINSRPAIQLTSAGTCSITDGDGKIMFQKKIIWESNQQLIFSSLGAAAKLEATYRIHED